MHELQTYVQMLLQNWWIVILTALAALNVSLIASYNTTPRYRASTRLIVSPGQPILASEGRDIVRGIESLSERSTIVTYSEILNSERVRQETFDRLNIESKQVEAYDIWAVVLPESSVLEIFVEGPSADVTALLANEISVYGINYIKALYQVYDISFLDQAMPPGDPFRPQPARDAALAVGLGIVIGAMLAIARGHIIAYFAKRLELGRSERAVSFRHRAISNRPTVTSLDYDNNGLAGHSADKLAIGIFQLNGLKNLPNDVQHQLFEASIRRVSSFLKSTFGNDDALSYLDQQQYNFKIIFTDVSDASMILDSYKQVYQMLKEPIKINADDEDNWLALDPHAGVSTGQQGLPVEILIQEATIALDKTYLNETMVVYDRSQRQRKNQSY